MDVKVKTPTEKVFREKPMGGYHKKNDCMITNYVPDPAKEYVHEYNTAIFPIPKNASSSLRNLIWTQNYKSQTSWTDPAFFVNILEQGRKIDKIIVVLRDPYERFISGLNMFLGIHQWEGGILKVSNQNDIMNVTILNEHFFPQSYYLEDLKKFTNLWNKIDFFYMSGSINVIEDITNHYDYIIKNNNDKLNWENQTQRIITSVDKEFVRSVYKDDYDLIEEVEFLNSKKISFI